MTDLSLSPDVTIDLIKPCEIVGTVWSEPIEMIINGIATTTLILEIESFTTRNDNSEKRGLIYIAFDEDLSGMDRDPYERGLWDVGTSLDRFRMNTELNIYSGDGIGSIVAYLPKSGQQDDMRCQIPRFHRSEMVVAHSTFSTTLGFLRVNDTVRLSFHSSCTNNYILIDSKGAIESRPSVISCLIDSVSRANEGGLPDIDSFSDLITRDQIKYGMKMQKRRTPRDDIEGLRRVREFAEYCEDLDISTKGIPPWHHHRLTALLSGKEARIPEDLDIGFLRFSSFANVICNVSELVISRRVQVYGEEKWKFRKYLISIADNQPKILADFDDGKRHRSFDCLFIQSPLTASAVSFTLRSLINYSKFNQLGNPTSKLKLICVVESVLNFPCFSCQKKQADNLKIRINLQVCDPSIGIPRQNRIYPSYSLALAYDENSLTEIPLFMAGDILLLRGVQLTKKEVFQSQYIDMYLDLTAAASLMVVFRPFRAPSTEHNIKFKVVCKRKGNAVGLTQREKTPQFPWIPVAPGTEWQETKIMKTGGTQRQAKPVELMSHAMTSISLPGISPEACPVALCVNIHPNHAWNAGDYPNILFRFNEQMKISTMASYLCKSRDNPSIYELHGRQFEVKLCSAFIGWVALTLNDSLCLSSGGGLVLVKSRFILDVLERTHEDEFDENIEQLTSTYRFGELAGDYHVMLKSSNLPSSTPTKSLCQFFKRINDADFSQLLKFIGVKISGSEQDPEEHEFDGSLTQRFKIVLNFITNTISDVEAEQIAIKYFVVEDPDTGTLAAVTGYSTMNWRYLFHSDKRRYPESLNEHDSMIKLRNYRFLPIVIYSQQYSTWLPVLAPDPFVRKFGWTTWDMSIAQQYDKALSKELAREIDYKRKGITLLPC